MTQIKREITVRTYDNAGNGPHWENKILGEQVAVEIETIDYWTEKAVITGESHHVANALMKLEYSGNLI